MALDTATIIKRLAAAPSQQKDNEAQNIINGASVSDLAGVDAEGVLRLYEALAMLPPRIYSSNDAAAMKRLKDNTQFQPVTSTPAYGVGLVTGAAKTKNSTLVTAAMVTNIYAAEKKRLSWGEWLGVDGATIGRGQLGQPAFTDVQTKFKNELEICATHVFVAAQLAGAPYVSSNIDYTKYAAIVPTQYSTVISYPPIEDFVVAAYLAIKIDAATKAGRAPLDSARFAVAVYHGMFAMVSAAQTAAGDTVNWSPVEAELNRQGHTDEVNYVNEVVK